MNRTTLLLVATTTAASLLNSHTLGAQARTNPIVWSVATAPTTISSGLVKVALVPNQAEWNAVAAHRAAPTSPWQLSYYQVAGIQLPMGKTFEITKKAGPTSLLPADARVRMQSTAVFVESPLGFVAAQPTATTVASITQQGGSVMMGNFESAQIASVLSALDSIVSSTPTLRELQRSVSETNTRATPTSMAHLGSGQTLFLDGSRRLVVVTDRLALVNGSQTQRSWPAATAWVMKTGDQFVSVLERIGYTK